MIGINGLLDGYYFGFSVQYSQVMGHLPTPVKNDGFSYLVIVDGFHDGLYIWHYMTMVEYMGLWYIPNEIAIFHRDNDQQNHWV